MKRLPPALELVLFRIVQESLTNVHRHAQSPSVDIQLQLAGSHATITVRDYGTGMPAALLQRLRAKGNSGGVGLSGMRERILQFNGSFEIQSDQTGTSIRAILPLTAERASTVGV